MTKRKYDSTVEEETAQAPGSKHSRTTVVESKSDAEFDGISEYSDSEESSSLNRVSSNQIEWQDTISKVVQSVVSISFIQLAFDADESVCSEATGFVVDAEKGYILTNRHVVSPGPLVNAYAIFNNHEECELTPIYRDPVHDYGVFKFDPKKIKYMELQSLELKPSLANVGLEIRVVGNDAGEKLSILSGFISRLDRNAPDYGEMTYNDFNTEYIQAAASASGGSSGSPVVNQDGYVVALQAGGSSQASTDFFLPLDRVHRTLQCLQQGKPITRGTIQTQWLLKPYDECRRLGLSGEKESLLRSSFPDKYSLLVAETVLENGPASGKIKAGDILVSIDGQLITSFIQVDKILDESVGRSVNILLQRSGNDVAVNCTVGNLHDITPNKYVEVCGASFHNLSYQMARLHGIPVEGVYVNSCTGSFDFNEEESSGWVIDQIDNKVTPNLDEFIKVMSNIPDKSRVVCKFHHLMDPHTSRFASLYIDRHWFKKFRMYTRNDQTGIWDITDLAEPIEALPLNKKSAKLIKSNFSSSGLNKVSNSLVMVSSKISVGIDSFNPDFNVNKSAGLIVDSKLGLVVVSRIIVPHKCLECFVTIADSIIVPAKVLFLHPTKNYAIVKYDPTLVDCDLQSATLSDIPLVKNDVCQFIGFNTNDTAVSGPATVSYVSPFNVGSNDIPRYRSTNTEAISINCPVSQSCTSGVLCDNDGTIRALWLTFLGPKSNGHSKLMVRGLDITDINQVIYKMQETVDGSVVPVKVYTIDADVVAITLLQARIRGVDDHWINEMAKSSSNVAQFISVDRASYSDEKDPLKKLYPGDVILLSNDKLVKNTRELFNELSDEVLSLKVVRDGVCVDLKIQPTETKETESVVIFSGCLIQEPHSAVVQCVTKLPSRVYISDCAPACPASQFGISSTNFITHVNEKETHDLETFMKVIKDIPENTYCKLNLVTFENVPFAVSLKTNYHYFPTAQLTRISETNTDDWTIKKFD